MPPEFLPTHHRSLRLSNLTAFKDVQFEFVPGVNVLLGENGAGKSHALKALYGLRRTSFDSGKQFRTFITIFNDYQPEQLIRWNAANALIQSGARTIRLFYDKDGPQIGYGGFEGEYLDPVFLPATDMIGHTKGFLALERDYGVDFDQTYGDIVSKLELATRWDASQLAPTEMAVLQNRIGGSVEYDGSEKRFYLVTESGRIEMPLAAEGLRKFATLHTIWKNGWLRPGTCLFWDEPEANLNPSLMDEAVAAILALSRGGVQVFLATHSYVILKELEVQATKEDSIRFFALEKTDDGTVVHPADRYLDIRPNLIEDQYSSLFERSLEKRIREQAESV